MRRLVCLTNSTFLQISFCILNRKRAAEFSSIWKMKINELRFLLALNDLEEKKDSISVCLEQIDWKLELANFATLTIHRKGLHFKVYLGNKIKYKGNNLKAFKISIIKKVTTY